MHYDEHGSFAIVVKDNILYLDAVGPFNDELGEAYATKMHEVILKHKPKAQISCLHNSVLLSPNIEENIKALLHYSLSYGLNYEAIILDSQCHEKKLFQIQMERISHETKYVHNFFDTKEEALSWINSLNLSELK